MDQRPGLRESEADAGAPVSSQPCSFSKNCVTTVEFIVAAGCSCLYGSDVASQGGVRPTFDWIGNACATRAQTSAREFTASSWDRVIRA